MVPPAGFELAEPARAIVPVTTGNTPPSAFTPVKRCFHP
ncbi:hypothetical protein L841_4270 [Mycobacterium sp. MAC_080597_8934]|nr:hypothetical protein L839_0143 [Mycobacterium avium MAV_120809_2495]ETZ64005.1 hypothetical protein L841_4270 [Mycobacterium sp. MAC_080597_8934]